MIINENIKVKIDFSNLEEIYSENLQDFILIIKKIQLEYVKYIDLLEDQIKAENIEEFRKTRHKISATLQLLKLIDFHEYLLFLKEHFMESFQGKEIVIENLKIIFMVIQENLKEKLNELEGKL